VHSMEDNQQSTEEVTQATCDNNSGGGWMFPALLLIVLGVALWFGQQPSANKVESETGTSPAAAWTPSLLPEGETVGLKIDFGNGASKDIAALPWQAGMTLEMLMHKAADFRPGITFTQQGSGELGFLTSLDGLGNQGPAGRNWQYRVNDKHGQMSFCLQPLKPGDQVLWGFASGEYDDGSE
jgi:hypothetical protein